MPCQRCLSNRLNDVGGKVSDLFHAAICDFENDTVLEHDGYVPDDMGIGGGDYLEMVYCLDCGQIQGKFPLEKTELEEQEAQ